MKISRVIIAFIILALLLLFFSILMQALSKRSNTIEVDKRMSKSTIFVESETEKIIVRGIIKKEKIPQDLELGDFWYWVYFDSPLYLENNASGEPSYVSKVEVYPPKTIQTPAFEAFLNTHVEIDGSWTGGYAESSVIQIDALKIIK